MFWAFLCVGVLFFDTGPHVVQSAELIGLGHHAQLPRVFIFFKKNHSYRVSFLELIMYQIELLVLCLH